MEDIFGRFYFGAIWMNHTHIKRQVEEHIQLDSVFMGFKNI